MGVLNVTPDSFSDGGLFLDAERAIAHGGELARAGADNHDIGGESTRPGAEAVAAEVAAFLEERLAFAVEAGIREDRICLDPGIGFGKTVEHNLELLRRLDEIVAIGRPVVIGTSRKSFLGKIAGGRDETERVPGTIATNVLALERGATVFRVHDVAQNVDALAVAAATFRLDVGERAG
jgi:dihydropteroate synthase